MQQIKLGGKKSIRFSPFLGRHLKLFGLVMSFCIYRDFKNSPPQNILQLHLHSDGGTQKDSATERERKPEIQSNKNNTKE